MPESATAAAAAVVCGLLLAAAPARAKAPDAEYAVRWDPRQGGPATPEDTLRALRLQPGERSRFEVQYFDFTPPPGLPQGFTPILRQRISGERHESSFKLRGAHPLPDALPLQQWACPLGATGDRKDEVDVSFVAVGQAITAYSRSCDLNARGAAVPLPAALQARPRGCASTMTRLRAGKLKVEQWQLADGSVLIEASRPGPYNPKSIRAFERAVVQPLLALKIQPLQRSKSAIGGDCAK
ncbi:MAG TPA: hypothetical protein PKB14_16155 [Rubrivivax sp.]|nr:hypothetical protein [Rubrivivax sp.]